MADSNVCMREHLQAIAAHGVVCKFAFNMLKLSVAAGCAELSLAGVLGVL